MLNALVLFLAAAGAGLLSAWGVGGGTALLLCLTLLLHADPEEARAVNLLFFLPTAAIALRAHVKNGLVDKEVWKRGLAPGLAMALLGAVLGCFLEVELLRRPFGILLLWAGASMLVKKKKNQDP